MFVCVCVFVCLFMYVCVCVYVCVYVCVSVCVECIEHIQLYYTTKKPMFYRYFSIFKLNDEVYTSVTTTGQSWPDYIGPKRENPQACLTNPVYALLP